MLLQLEQSTARLAANGIYSSVLRYTLEVGQALVKLVLAVGVALVYCLLNERHCLMCL